MKRIEGLELVIVIPAIMGLLVAFIGMIVEGYLEEVGKNPELGTQMQIWGLALMFLWMLWPFWIVHYTPKLLARLTR